MAFGWGGLVLGGVLGWVVLELVVNTRFVLLLFDGCCILVVGVGLRC